MIKFNPDEEWVLSVNGVESFHTFSWDALYKLKGELEKRWNDGVKVSFMIFENKSGRIVLEGTLNGRKGKEKVV